MSWHWSGISLLLLAGAGYLTVCAVYVWRYRRGPTAVSLMVVLAALAQWGVVRAGAAPARKRELSSPATQNRLTAHVADQTIASSSTVASSPPWTIPSKPMCSARGEKST